MNQGCILKGRKSVQVSQDLTTSLKGNILILGDLLGNNSEKEGKTGGEITSLTVGEVCMSEGFCPGARMTWKRTLIKKNTLSFSMDNDFDLKIWLLFDIIKELMFLCLFYGLYLICHLMDLLIIPVGNAWDYFMCTEVRYGHLLTLSSISCLTVTNIDL